MRFHLTLRGARFKAWRGGWAVRRRWPVGFPLEVRSLAGDDLWLSMAHGGPRAFVAVHTVQVTEAGDVLVALAAVLLVLRVPFLGVVAAAALTAALLRL